MRYSQYRVDLVSFPDLPPAPQKKDLGTRLVLTWPRRATVFTRTHVLYVYHTRACAHMINASLIIHELVCLCAMIPGNITEGAQGMNGMHAIIIPNILPTHHNNQLRSCSYHASHLRRWLFIEASCAIQR